MDRARIENRAMGVFVMPGPARHVEMFFRTVRNQFLSEENGQCLERLNAGLDHWLAAYRERPHASLETTPLKKRLQSENARCPLPEVAGIEDLFRMTRRCRVYKDGTIRLRKRIFEVPNCVPGDRVDVYLM